LLSFVLLAGVSKAQNLFLTFPSTVHICDVKDLEMNGAIEYLTNDLFDIRLPDELQKYWRYTFEWYNEDGVRIGFYNSHYGQYFDPSKSDVLRFSDYKFHTGLYTLVFKVYKLDPAVNGGEVQVFSQTKQKHLTVEGDNLNWDSGLMRGMVSGDFDQDGFEDEVLVCYDHGPNHTGFYVWTSDAYKMNFAWDWYTSTHFDANRVEGRFVSGDFNRDGVKDDVAAIYDYGGNQTKIHIWHANAATNSMDYQGVWWTHTNYDANQITGRLVAGDFNEDGYEDDLAAFYDYGGANARLHIWENNSGSFSHSGTAWISGFGLYNPTLTTGKIVSGDFDGDGYHGDIMAFYAFQNAETKVYMWRADGGGTMTGPFTKSHMPAGNYDAHKITGRVVSGDFDSDGRHDDFASYYDYGNNETRIHYWRGDGATHSGAWTPYNSGAGNFAASAITNRTVSGDFDRDGVVDNVVTMYRYSNEKSKLFLWRDISHNTTAYYNEVWQVCGNPYNKQGNVAVEIEEEVEDMTGLTVKVFPNPSQGYFKVDLVTQESGTLNLYGYDGRKVKTMNLVGGINQVDVEGEPAGVYIVEIIAGEERTTEKLIIR